MAWVNDEGAAHRLHRPDINCIEIETPCCSAAKRW